MKQRPYSPRRHGDPENDSGMFTDRQSASSPRTSPCLRASVVNRVFVCGSKEFSDIKEGCSLSDAAHLGRGLPSPEPRAPEDFMSTTPATKGLEGVVAANSGIC